MNTQPKKFKYMIKQAGGIYTLPKELHTEGKEGNRIKFSYKTRYYATDSEDIKKYIEAMDDFKKGLIVRFKSPEELEFEKKTEAIAKQIDEYKSLLASGVIADFNLDKMLAEPLKAFANGIGVITQVDDKALPKAAIVAECKKVLGINKEK